jgi:hypothetical protein
VGDGGNWEGRKASVAWVARRAPARCGRACEPTMNSGSLHRDSSLTVLFHEIQQHSSGLTNFSNLNPTEGEHDHLTSMRSARHALAASKMRSVEETPRRGK